MQQFKIDDLLSCFPYLKLVRNSNGDLVYSSDWDINDIKSENIMNDMPSEKDYDEINKSMLKFLEVCSQYYEDLPGIYETGAGSFVDVDKMDDIYDSENISNEDLLVLSIYGIRVISSEFIVNDKLDFNSREYRELHLTRPEENMKDCTYDK